MISTQAAWLAVFLFAGMMTYAGIKDVATMTISNRLVLALTASFALLAPAAGLGVTAIFSSILIASGVLVCTFALFSLGWIGGGDAKLLPLAVLWLGSDLALDFMLYTALIGAAVTLALLQFRRLPLPILLKRKAWSARLHAPETGVPYGAAMSDRAPRARTAR